MNLELTGKKALISAGHKGIGYFIATRLLEEYGATKAATINLIAQLAQRWGAEGIRANTVSPGPYSLSKGDGMTFAGGSQSCTKKIDCNIQVSAWARAMKSPT